MNKVNLRGINVYPFSSKEELLDYVIENKRILIAINAEKIMNATDDLKRIINDNIGYCDGIGAVMAVKKKGGKQAVRLPGCELWLDIVKILSQKNKSFYLVGGKQPVIEATVAQLKQDFPDINIVGYRNGYLGNDNERKLLIQDVIDKKPDVVFVAMGSPKQELLMQEMLKAYPAIYQGLGGSFDVYVGNVKRAPKVFCKLGLEWFYRLLMQPTRIKRQLVYVKFMVYYYFNKL